jgi:hypothetical protein
MTSPKHGLLLGRFAGTLIVGAFAAAVLASEWGFGRRARSGQAVVVSTYSYRAGKVTDVNHLVGGAWVPATLYTWHTLRPGQRVPVVYLPGRPDEVVLDWFSERHYRSAAALAFLVVVALGESLRFAAWRRRQTQRLLADRPPEEPGVGEVIQQLERGCK